MASLLKVSVKVIGVEAVRKSMRGMTAGLADQLHEVTGNNAAILIRENAAAGRGLDGPLSPYLSAGKKARGSRTIGETPNLTDTGKMLSGVRYNKSKRVVTIDPTGERDQIGLWIQNAEGNNPTGRRWFGVPPKDQPKFDKTIGVAAGKIVRDNRGNGYETEGTPIVVQGSLSQIDNP